MNAYALLKNGRCEQFKVTSKNMKKYSKGKINVFLLECWHPVFGYFYISQKYKEFRKMLRYKKPRVSYKFLDGILVDDEDDDYLFVKNKYYYNHMDELFAKMLEIYINENIFNDSFWVYDSFFQYIYDNIKVEVKTSKHKKKTFKNNSFYKKFISYEPIIKKRILDINGDTYKTLEPKNAKGKVLAQVYPNVWFKVDSDIFNIGKFRLNTKILLYSPLDDDTCVINKRYYYSSLKPRHSMFNLKTILETYVSKQIIRKLEDGVYNVKTVVKFKNKKINKKKYKFKKFVHKYFIDLPK